MKRRSRRRGLGWLGRALTGLALGAGLGAIALAFLLPAGGSPPPPPPHAAALDGTASPARPMRASGGGAAEAAVASAARPPSRAPARQAPPLDAPPVLDARSLGGGPRGTSSSPPAPFTVALVTGDPRLDAVAGLLGEALRTRGIGVRSTSLEAAGRPDALIALGAAAGAAEAWHCEPGPQQSAVLAGRLLDAVDRPAGGPGAAAAEGPATAFPCEAVHAGRARVPAVLLELPETALADAAPAAVAAAVSKYFDEERAAVLAARSAPRLVWPASGPVTSHFGPSHPLGIDIGQWLGPVRAATEGTVSFAGGDACCSYGLYVVVDGPGGLRTLYAHLSSIAVKQGQRVRQGQVLGQVGCTGTCFGTHLHFEVVEDGRRQDPMQYLP